MRCLEYISALIGVLFTKSNIIQLVVSRLAAPYHFGKSVSILFAFCSKILITPYSMFHQRRTIMFEKLWVGLKSNKFSCVHKAVLGDLGVRVILII